VELTEAQVKQGVEEYLQIAMNQGKLWYCRLNAGDIYIPNKDGSHRLFKGVKPGTADLLVIQGGQVEMSYGLQKKVQRCYPVALVTFIECKSTKGRLRQEQEEFKEMITEFNCRFCLVRSVDELIEVLERE